MKTPLMIRMTAPIIAVSILLLAIGGMAAWYIQSLDRSNSEVLDSNISSVRAAQEFEIGLREIRTALNNFRLTGDRKQLEAIPPLQQQIDRALEDAQRWANTETEQVLIDQAKSGYRRFIQEFERSQREGSSQKHAQILVEDIKKILEASGDYLNLNMDMARQSTQENKTMAMWTVVGLLLLGVCGAGAGLLGGMALAQRLGRSFVRLNLTIQDAAGKLNEVTEPVTLSSGGDFQELEETLGKVGHRITAVVRQLQQSQQEVFRAEQLAALGQMAAGLAHELRNPMTAIKVLVQSAADQGERGQLSGQDLVILEEEISRMEGAIQNFLDFARPPRLEKRTMEMRQILEQTLDLVAPRARHQGVRLIREFPQEPVMVQADAGQIRQVVLNLLLNALDVLPQGGTVGVHLSLRNGVTHHATEDGEIFTLQVSDNGPGLPAQLGERIFDPFTSTKETGLGLGLSICKRIVEAHAGSIAAANRPEGGTVFKVQLPLVTTLGSEVRGRESEIGDQEGISHAPFADRG